METFHFSETVQVLSNPTSITQSIIDSQYHKNQPLLTQSSTHNNIQQPGCGKSNELLSTLGITQGNLRLTLPPTSLD